MNFDTGTTGYGTNTSSDYRRNELQKMQVAPPLDLSFQKASDLNELEVKRAQTVRTGKAPVRNARDKFETSSLWLSNNSFGSMDGLVNLAKRVLDDYLQLCWLDLSMNEIKKIGEEITEFSNLKILYLHGNNVTDINDVVKLRKLNNLRSLSLHGNPVERIPYYRGYIIHILPQISCLDFSAVISAEKKRVEPAGFRAVIHLDT